MSRKRSIIVVLCLLMMVISACSEAEQAPRETVVPTVTAELAEEGEARAILQSREGTNEWFAEYAAFIEETMAASNLPGAAVAVVLGDESVFLEGFGVRDLKSGASVTPETLFHIASTHKSMTAMMIATLVDEGLLEWDTPVVEIYPDFELSDAEATQLVTIRHLLSMRSGIPDDAEDDFDLEDSTAAEVFDLVAEAPLLGLPGDAFSYSNPSSAISGYLGVLAAGGEVDDLYDGYADLLQEQLLDPIGMNSATIYASQARQNPNLSNSYILDDNNQPIEADSYDVDGDPLAPSGSLKASAAEMALYISTQLNRGVAPNGTQVVSAKNLTETWTPYLENYAMGWETHQHQGVKLIQHEGSYDNFLSIIGFIPQLNAGFVILTNSEDAGGPLIADAPLMLVELLLQNQ
ncbi:MAG: serine hydrolase domain-containing protein [Ardenticatenaceae bacterium]